MKSGHTHAIRYLPYVANVVLFDGKMWTIVNI